jgi:hypothetical protein
MLFPAPQMNLLVCFQLRVLYGKRYRPKYNSHPLRHTSNPVGQEVSMAFIILSEYEVDNDKLIKRLRSVRRMEAFVVGGR